MLTRPFVILCLVLATTLAAMLVIAADSPSGRAEFLVPKITCGACAQTIGNGLQALPGIVSAEVDVANTRVKVAYDQKRTDPGEIAQALTRLGYPGRLVATGNTTVPGYATTAKSSGCGGNCCNKQAAQ